MTRHDGNLAVAAGVDDRGQAAEEVFFLQLVDELVFEFIRHQVTAIGIGACTQAFCTSMKFLWRMLSQKALR